MNKLYCLIILLIHCKMGNGQNLILNPSFEDTIECPFFYGQIDFATGCYYFKNYPDYFNTCSTVLMGVPVNDVGFQMPRTGNAYGGIITYSDGDTLYREWIGMQLIQPLLAGMQYNISFFASMAYKNIASGLHMSVASNKLGVRFSTVPIYWNNTLPINGYVSIYTDSIIADTINWVEIGGSFIADSAYNYIVIGNFFDDFSTSHYSIDGLPGYAYYYIDDVCVSDSVGFCYLTTGLNDVENTQGITVLPNPFKNELTISANGNDPFEIIIYDAVSRKIVKQKFINTFSLNTQQFVKGIYFYELRNKYGIIKKGKLVRD